MENQLLMDRTGNLYGVRHDRLVPFSPKGRSAPRGLDTLLATLQRDPMASFFKTPFHRVAYSIGDRLQGTFPMTPGDFSPGSVFDAVRAVRSYLSKRELLLPRMYLYPTAECTSRCVLCQFHHRHRQGGSLSGAEWRQALDIFFRHKGDVHEQSLIISGDGEATLYPEIREILETARAGGARIFLTTNLLTPFTGNEALYRRMAESCAMITVSIKGLTPEAYAEQQGLPGLPLLQQVYSNLEALLALRAACGRERECLIGVASLILPQNSDVYISTIDKLSWLGVDYFYLNQVEPSLEKWGISFTEEEKYATLRQLAEYDEAPHTGMIVRCASNPFRQRYGDTVYYDAARLRRHPDICGSALFNPLVLSSPGGARWCACRNGDLFADDAFRHTVADGRLRPGAIDRVMRAAAGCRACRLERQVKHFDRIIDVERRYGCGAEYHLVFDVQQLLDNRHWFGSFDQVAK